MRQPVIPRSPETPQPRSRMQDCKRQYTHQENGHEPKRVEEKWILLGIMVRGMCEISGEFPMRTCVALSTGLHNIPPTETGVWVICRQNIMCAVAVIAFGSSLRAKATNLTMVRIEKRLSFIMVTAATLPHHCQPKSLYVGSSNGMGCVAILARWEFLLCLHVFRPVDAPLESLFDTMMAAAARRSDVIGVHR